MVIVGLSLLMVFILAINIYVAQTKRILNDTETYATDQLNLVFNIVELYKGQANKSEQKGNIVAALSSCTFIGEGYPLLIDANGAVYASPKSQFSEEDKKMALAVRESLHSNKELTVSETNYNDCTLYHATMGGANLCAIIKLPTQQINAAINTKLSIVLLASIFFLSIFIYVVARFSKNIAASLIEGLGFTQAIVTGDLQNTMPIERNDEMGDLANSLNGMTHKLSEVAKEMSVGALDVKQTARGIYKSTKEVSDGALHQATTIAKLVSTVDGITDSFKNVSLIALKTGQLASQTSYNLDKVNLASVESSSAIKQIAHKINVVSKIAFKTNLLALNAAVEAARAGNQGRGFVVVANEVRKLAEMSKLAAQDINKLSERIVKVTELSDSELQNMIPQMKESGLLITKVVQAIIDIEKLIQPINAAIQQLNQVSHSNALLAEDMFAATGRLTSSIKELSIIIKFFKT